MPSDGFNATGSWQGCRWGPVNERVCALADEMASAFGERLRAGFGGDLVGLYLVGSYVLGDLQAEGDVDFIAVMCGERAAARLADLRAIHSWMSLTYPQRPFEGLYVRL